MTNTEMQHKGDIKSFIADGYRLFFYNQHHLQNDDLKSAYIKPEELEQNIEHTSKLKYFGSGDNYMHIPTPEAPVIDIDNEVAQWLVDNYNYFSPRYTHGRNGNSHLVQRISDPHDLKDVHFLTIDGVNFGEIRFKGQTVASGKYNKPEGEAFIIKQDSHNDMTFNQVWQNIHEVVLISALSSVYISNLFNFRLCVVGELKFRNILEDDAQRIFQRFLDYQKTLITSGYKDKYTESYKDIAKLYSRDAGSTFDNLVNTVSLSWIKSVRTLLDNYYKPKVYEKTVEQKKDKQPEYTPQSVEAFRSSDLSEVMQKTYPEKKWIIPEILPSGLAFLSAKSGAGKTRFLHWLLVQILFGNRIWDRYDLVSGQMLALSLEDDEEDWQDRTKQMGFNAVDHGLTLVTMEDWQGERLGGLLEAKIEKWIQSVDNPQVVLIDTYGTVSKPKRGKDNYMETVQELLPLRKLARKYNIVILCTHHNKKVKETHSADNSLGSTAIMATADTRIIVDSEENSSGTITLDISGRRVKPVKWKLSQEVNNEWNLISDNAHTYRENGNKMERNIKKAFLDLNVDSNSAVTVRAITNHLGLTVKGVKLYPDSNEWRTHDNYKKKFKRMYDDGILEKYDRGLYYPDRSNDKGTSFWCVF